MHDPSTTLLGVSLPFPVMNAPGTPTGIGELRVLARHGIGALCLRTATLHPFVHREFRSLHNPGHDKLLTVAAELAGLGGPPVIASIAGGTPDEYAVLARAFADAGVALVEANLADPWVERALAPYEDLTVLAEVLARLCEACPVPVLIRLPQPGRTKYAAIADTLAAAGVRGVVISNDFEGLEKFRIEAGGEFEIVGAGHVKSGYDVTRALAKGARALQVGAVLHVEGPRLFARLRREMRGRDARV